MRKKDLGTIFNPVMYICLIIFMIALALISFEYRRVCWLSESMTDSITDALLAAAVLNEDELRSYYNSLDTEIFYPAPKFKIFKKVLQDELGLDETMHVKANGMPMLSGKLRIEDFIIYSVKDNDVMVYTFTEDGSYTISLQKGKAGICTAPNGEIIRRTSLFAQISFEIDFMGIRFPAYKYHMVSIKDK